MPASWLGFPGGTGRGADGAATVFIHRQPRPEARQSVAFAASLTTLWRKSGNSALSGESRGAAPHWHRVDPHVRFDTISAADRDPVGGQRP